MESNQIKRLEALKNRSTSYELAMIRGDEKILIRYTNSRSRGSLLRNCRAFGAAIVAITGREDITFGKLARDGAACGEWAIKFTGHTEREAILNGELPFIAARARQLELQLQG